ncbi:MAG TPA: hypothetical protein VJ947_01145 [Pseudohaliea sp.]|nr:hypothetical protein [Pseudohaliea sp.]
MSLHGGRATGPDTPQSPPWSRRLRKIMATGWASFLTACVASVLFFAVFDPARLAEAADWPLELSRMGGYALLFFFFWAIGVGAASMTLVLMRRERRGRPPEPTTDKD